MTENKNNTAFFLSLFGISLLLILFLAVLMIPQQTDNEILKLREMMANDGHIIHAGGFVDTKAGMLPYTNSLEALENLYARGNRFCEIDLQETADGMIICGHGDETELVFGTGLRPGATGEEFMKCRIYGELTPISLAGLAAFMREKQDLFVIPDVKSDNIRVCRRIAEEFPDLKKQFIVQAQLPEEYDVIRAMGFPFIVYPIFKTPDSERNVLSLTEFVRRHELVAMVVPNGYYMPDLKLRLAERIIGVPFVLHTVNDGWEMDYYLSHGLALAVYTDRTDCWNGTEEG